MRGGPTSAPSWLIGDPAVRRALGLLLTHELSFQLVREATTPEGLRRQIRRVQPDILVVDWTLVAAEPAGLFPTLRGLCPHLRILALGLRAEVRAAALGAGADGFVGKGEGPDQIIRALHALCGATHTTHGEVP